MPRAKSEKRENLVSTAMLHFWRHGYEATSVDDLVRATGVSRQGIYGDAGGKDALFVQCLHAYVEAVVTPAFARVERNGAMLDSVADYFEHQIARGQEAGLPGPGCLLTNTMTEVAPHRNEIMHFVARHNERLLQGFAAAITNTATAAGRTLDRRECYALATTLVVFANGLWTMSRTVDDAAVLRGAVLKMLQLTNSRIAA